MAGQWDGRMKRLVKDNPQDFVTWLAQGARYHSELNAHLPSRNIDADTLFKVTLDGRLFLLHIEFQTRRDRSMAKRLWEYNVLTTCKYKLPVRSYVIYLKKDRSVAKSPLVIALPDGEEIHRFKFTSIELYKFPTAQIKQTGLIGLLPLLPLTKEGAKQVIVEEMITDIQRLAGEEAQGNLLSFGFAFASLAFEKQEADQDWLIRRFQMLEDILQETEIYKYIKREGREEGLQESLQEMREALQRIVQARFPKLVRLAKGQTSIIEDPKALRDLIVKISIAQNAKEARLYLLGEEDDEE